MIMTLLLPWFPIILGVGVGGRLLGRSRGFTLGLICALFWVCLIQASCGVTVWSQPWIIPVVLAGVTAIVAMGGWAGQDSSEQAEPEAEPQNQQSRQDAAVEVEDQGCDRISVLLNEFEEWLEAHRDDNNPWPEFDEFIRSALGVCCEATHVRPYALAGDGDELKPLWEPDPFTEVRRLSARKGIIGHVATSGRCYVAGDPTQGELVARLADEWEDPIAWCFAVCEGPRKIGVVVVAQLNMAPERNRSLLRAAEKVIGRCWLSLREASRCRAAALDDPVSGAFTRAAFFGLAERSLRESYAQGEPVALAIVALEKLREINDSGRWEVADDLVRQVGAVLRRKLRVDDHLGRFDGSRFVILIRRVDSGLASLIVTQIMSQLKTLCGNLDRWGVAVTVRCGVVGSGTAEPDLRVLVSKGLMQCRRARLEGLEVASDLGESKIPSEAVL